MGWIATAEDDVALVMIAPCRESQVGGEPLGHHHIARRDGALNERSKTVCRRVTDTPHPNATNRSAADFCRDRHKSLPPHVATASPRFQAPHKRFVHLDRARESVTFWTNHGPAQLVEPRPSRAVTPQPEYALQPHRIGSILLARQPPHCSAPQAQRLVRLVEDRTSRERPLHVTRDALDAIPGRPPSCVALAVQTHDPPRPAKRHEIRSAVRLRAESVFELQLRPRVILCTRLGFHVSSILKPELSAYPVADY